MFFGIIHFRGNGPIRISQTAKYGILYFIAYCRVMDRMCLTENRFPQELKNYEPHALSKMESTNPNPFRIVNPVMFSLFSEED